MCERALAGKQQTKLFHELCKANEVTRKYLVVVVRCARSLVVDSSHWTAVGGGEGAGAP